MHKTHRQESVVYRGVGVARLPFALKEMEKRSFSKLKMNLQQFFITTNLHFLGGLCIGLASPNYETSLY